MSRTGIAIGMAIAVLVGVVGGLACWASSGNAVSLVEVPYDRAVTYLTGRDPFTRCYTSRPTGNPVFPTELEFERDKASCYQPVARYSGLYVDEFEGGAFIDGATSADQASIPCENPTELIFRSSTQPQPFGQGGPTRFWTVVFDGRKSPSWPDGARLAVPLTWGGSDNVILVERLISRRPLTDADGRLTNLVETNCDSPH